MKLLRIALIGVALIAVEITESPFRKIIAELGFVPDEVKAAQCLTVSHFLPEHEAHAWSSAASEKIAYWLEHESGCSTPKECMQRQFSVTNWAEQKAHPDGNSPSRDIINKWKNSEYCQALVASYRDKELAEANRREAEIIAKNKEIEEALKRQVDYYSRSLVDADSREISCKKFKEQVDVTYNNPSVSKYRANLSAGLRATLAESLFKLKKFQYDQIESQISSDQLEALSKDIYIICSDDAIVSDQIGLTDRVRNLESPRSSIIRSKIRELQNDATCGDLSEVYCLADLRRDAGNIALEISRKCDSVDNISEQCFESAEDIYLMQLKTLELERLTQEKKMYERYIENPSGSRLFNSANAQSNIYLIAEKCKRSAIDRGLRGAEYQKQVKEVCEPNAKLEFLSPQISVLNKIIHRMEQLGG